MDKAIALFSVSNRNKNKNIQKFNDTIEWVMGEDTRIESEIKKN